MPSRTRVYSLPRWRITRWLADCGPGVPGDIRVELIGNLFGNLPVFAGGVINTVAVALVITARQPTALFFVWLVFEVVLCVSRLIVLLVARRAALNEAETPTDIYLLLAILGAPASAMASSSAWRAATGWLRRSRACRQPQWWAASAFETSARRGSPP
jgi:hypothetical protein